jgi:glycosyltransferase involved in cell wall biosynthesis
MTSSQAGQLDLAVALTTFNSMRTIERVLESVRGLASKIVVIDSGSTDGTIDCCRTVGAEVIHRPWAGHVPGKRAAVEYCAPHQWVLILDSDESLEPDLQNSVRRTIEANDPTYDAWEINRKVWFLGGWLNYCYQPEWRLRLFRRGRERIIGTGPDGTLGHDRIEVSGRVGRLEGVCRHDSWADIHDLLRRNVSYGREASTFARGGGGLLDILTRPGATFFKQLILRRGLLDGSRGAMVAGGAACGTLMKHLFIAERRLRNASNAESLQSKR